MSRALPLLAVAICCWSGLAAAQDRPEPKSPEAEAAATESAAEAVSPDDSRPPERPEDAAPDTAEPKPDAEKTPQDQPADDPSEEKPEADQEEAAEQFGPPPPPQWYLLRESDQEYDACKLGLSMLGTSYREEPAITDDENPECGIARPIRVDQIIPDLTLEGGAVMRCDTARALGLWAQDFLRPGTAMLPGAPRVTSLQLGTTYDCRGRIGTGEAQPKVSEHAFGNAIDIAAFVMDNGEVLTVEPRVDTGDITEGFQMAMQKAGCLFFTTVLGPGSNAAHDNHLHFDVAVRNGGWRLCE